MFLISSLEYFLGKDWLKRWYVLQVYILLLKYEPPTPFHSVHLSHVLKSFKCFWHPPPTTLNDADYGTESSGSNHSLANSIMQPSF